MTAPADVPPDMHAEAAEVREAEPPKPTDFFVRAGAGIGRGQLFLGSANAREASRIPLAFEVGKMVSQQVGVSALALVEPGRTDHGIAMTRVVIGGSCEFHFGPLFLGGGPHATWFGATRKSAGPAGSFEAAESVIWRLGLGMHAMVGVDIHATKHGGIFTAVRADADALLAITSTPVPYGSVSGVIGLSFY